ncbi:hypothetical protein CONCODRAFT_8011 [Conidiobolus coronatus NRRL 28638]|uniref:Uncharacterized protein n=1 Tax=Conidiobolus coronatus (strain ATCC 28846 / CBS 209.66 / NRRL 28638) TaxID=796925 RepID=A0A137P3S1_CONC2|nr:hypothetical protein CONCODRAFT_8011 [Conidiobolus coronatus NRRL 28638]|eukprot:KXN69589.1 hypothetical protein CONCODRAFT_8011 [Conidiobolus coronatus NRRL 28638]
MSRSNCFYEDTMLWIRPALDNLCNETSNNFQMGYFISDDETVDNCSFNVGNTSTINLLNGKVNDNTRTLKTLKTRTYYQGYRILSNLVQGLRHKASPLPIYLTPIDSYNKTHNKEIRNVYELPALGNKSIGVQLLQRYLKAGPEQTLHVGDQFLSTGNDYANSFG